MIRFALAAAVVAILLAIVMILLIGGWVGLALAGGCLVVALGLMMWSDRPSRE